MTARLDHDIAAIAALHHGIFAVHHLDELGASREFRLRRLASGRWEALHDCVYRMAGAPVTWRGGLLAACWAGGARAVASHRSAAALWEFPGARRDLTELTCPRWRRARHPGLTTHETTSLTDADRDELDGIPCTSVERTIFDMCVTSGPTLIDLIIDSALRRELTDVDRLIATRDRLAGRGRRGASRFRAALDDRGPQQVLPESPPERILARALVRQGLPNPVRQFVVRGVDDRFVARVDLAYPEQKILIEYDSYQEHVGKAALARDSARRNALTALGYTTLTATAVDVNDGAQRLAEAVRAVMRRVA
jgi:very-short-patch-repair endonuclease